MRSRTRSRQYLQLVSNLLACVMGDRGDKRG